MVVSWFLWGVFWFWVFCGWLVLVLGSFIVDFVTECCQLTVYFQGTSSAKGSILLSYVFAFIIAY